MRDEVFTNAICCLAASHMQSNTSSDNLFSNLSQLVLKFKHQTIVALNRRLTQLISEAMDPTAYSVVALMASEVRALNLYRMIFA